MPNLPRYTADQRRIGAGATPSNIGTGADIRAGAELGQQIEQFGQVAAKLGARLQEQKDESDFMSVRNAFNDSMDKIKMDLMQDPETYQSPAAYPQKFARLADAVLKYTNGVLLKDSSDTAKNMFHNYLSANMHKTLIEADAEGKRRFRIGQLDKLEVEAGQFAREAAGAVTPEARDRAIGMYTERVKRSQARGFMTEGKAEGLLVKFDQIVLDERAGILVNTSHESRQIFYQLVAEKEFARLDPLKLQRHVSHAMALDERRSAIDRENEKAVKAAENARANDLLSMIIAGDRKGALDKLKIFADSNMLDDATGRAIYNELTSPPKEVDDQDTANRVLMDTARLYPQTTHNEVMRLLQSKHLSTKTALQAVNRIREAQTAQKSEWARDHAQAEQNLAAMLGIKRTLIDTKLMNDPPGKLWSVLLEELVNRSRAYNRGGKEDPLAVVAEFRERVNTTLGQKYMLKSDEINRTYPSFQQLEEARNNNWITQESYDAAMQQRGAPKGLEQKSVPAPAPSEPTPAKREKHGR